MLIKVRRKIKYGIGTEKGDSSALSPIHFMHPNYIMETRKQSQEVAIVIDDVVIL